MSSHCKEHKPVIDWLRERADKAKFRAEIDTSKIDTAVEISSMICGIDGCNFTCRKPCEAIKFILLTYLGKDTPITHSVRLFEDAVARYG